MMSTIVNVHYPDLEAAAGRSFKSFYWVRCINGLQKKPSTSELLDWVQALTVGGISPEKIAKELPFLGVLLKKDRDFNAVLQRLHSQGTQKRTSAPGFMRNW